MRPVRCPKDTSLPWSQSLKRERSKALSAPEAKPLQALTSRFLRARPLTVNASWGFHAARVEFLPQDRLLIGCERAADPRQHLRRKKRARPPASAIRASTPHRSR